MSAMSNTSPFCSVLAMIRSLCCSLAKTAEFPTLPYQKIWRDALCRA
jgi:hypothetical protein